jgi:hypothetical protein
VGRNREETGRKPGINGKMGINKYLILEIKKP